MNSPHLLIDALLRPEPYPHPVRELERLETHISWILLTGEFAYKIKKPVNLGFLDFSTLELREHFCREELRLNRRYAEELYLDVIPITGTEENPRLGGDGEPIEFAVKMRQFPQSALLSTRLVRGELTALQIEDLARRLARFHDRAEVAPLDGPFATPDEVLQEATDNLNVLERHLPERWQPLVATLRDWTGETWSRLKPTFSDRRRQGRIRECHGDLHLGNVIEWNGRILPFDGIEFNDAFRWIDVLSDAAFLAMDLCYPRNRNEYAPLEGGRSDLAGRFLNACLEQSGDYAGLAVWRWYLVYRALVRAKVDLIRATQVHDEQNGNERERDELNHAVTHLLLAEAFIQPRVPRLIITHGPSGSGKTTGTEPLIERGAIRLRSDVERKRLFGLQPEESSDSALGEGIYTAEATRRTYLRLADCAEQILRAGETAVVDATFLTRPVREMFRDLAERMDAEFEILPFTADPETLRRRIRERLQAGTDASEATFEVLEKQLAVLDPLNDEERRFVR
jgi:uncharacterized protein